MTIWFDISNAPHVNLFKDLIEDLKKENHDIVITCRPLSNTISLLKLHGMPHKVVGRHYGKSLLKKIAGYPIRVFQLRNYLRKQKIDVAISQSSFHSPLVARSLNIPCIYMNDNEHAAGNIPSFLFADKILIPEFLDPKIIARQGASIKKIISYPGVKEGIYLWKNFLEKDPQTSILPDKIFIRPEPHTAQYYKGGENFLDQIIIDLKERYKIVILARDDAQREHFQGKDFQGVSVPEESYTFTKISKECILFIGAGGTMTREMAVIGIPTISVYRDDLLEVDKHLLQLGLMEHLPYIKTNDILKVIEAKNKKSPDKELLMKGKDAFKLIKSTLEEIKKQ